MTSLREIASAANWLLVATSLLAWILFYLRRRSAPRSHLESRLNPSSWLNAIPRSPVPWGIMEWVLVILATLLVPLLFSIGWLAFRGVSLQDYEQLLKSDATSSFSPLQLEMMVVDGVARLTSVAVACFLIHIQLHPTSSDWGVSIASITSDLRLAMVAFLLIVPPVLFLKWLLLTTFPDQLAEAHPLIQRVRAYPNSMQLFAATAFSAVLVAPVFEEFFFRLILQGGMERWATTGSPFSDRRNQLPASVPSHAWPLWISSLLFAGLHLGHGIDPVPLFFLSLGLGYLYRQTHRILPGVLVHWMLNSLTMIQLWIEVAASRE